MDGRGNPEQRRPGPGENPRGPASHWTLILWLFILFILVGPWIANMFSPKGTPISYTTFRRQLETGNVQKVIVQGEQISGELKTPAEDKAADGKPVSYRQFVTYVPSFGDENRKQQRIHATFLYV